MCLRASLSVLGLLEGRDFRVSGAPGREDAQLGRGAGAGARVFRHLAAAISPDPGRGALQDRIARVGPRGVVLCDQLDPGDRSGTQLVSRMSV